MIYMYMLKNMNGGSLTRAITTVLGCIGVVGVIPRVSLSVVNLELFVGTLVGGKLLLKERHILRWLDLPLTGTSRAK